MPKDEENEENMYEGNEIIVDEQDEHLTSIHFLSNGVVVLIDNELWSAVKEELLEALSN